MRTAGSVTSLILLLSVLSVQQGNAADTSVKIEGNGSNSSATVNIQNSFNSSSTDSNTVDSHTKVRIETNGEVKEYETHGDEDIHIESSDGTSTVNITNQGDATRTPSILPDVNREEIEEKIDDVKREAEEKITEMKEEQKNFIERIVDSISNFFGNLF